MGIAPSDIVGDAAVLLRTILPEDTPRFIQAEAKSRDTLARFEIEVRLRHPRTDEVRWALLRSSPRRRADGSTVWDGVQLDITERRRVEEALRASEEKYRTILESIEDGYYEVDLDGSLTFFNDSLCRLYGYSKDEMMGMNYRQYMNEETAKVVYQTFNTVYQTKKPTKAFDWEVIRKDGSTMFVQLSISLMRAPSGKRVGFRGIVRDITEHRQMEEALRQNRANLQAILDNFPFMVWLKDTEGRFVAVNEPFARSCGRSSPDDVIGGTDLDVWPADLAAGYRADDLEVMRSRQKKSMEERVADQGIEKWVETFKAPLFDLNGNIIGTTGFARDITERKRADEVLRESRANLQTILDNFPFMAWLKDVEGRFVAVNKPFAHACGLNTPDELIGKTDLDVWPPNLANSYRADDFEVMRLGQKKAVEELVADQGIERWFETFKAPLFDLSGHVTGTTGFARDITERKQMEESLRHANSTLQALFDHSPLSIIMLSVTGNIVLWNQAAESLYGWTVQEVFGKPLPTIPTEKLEEYQALRARVNHGESIPYMEIVRQRKDGSEISLGVSIAPLRDATGNVYAQVSIAADITERKRAENKLQQRTRELDALQATVLDIASPHPLPELLQLIVERASNLLASSSGGLYLCHPERWEVECVVSYNTLRDYTGTVLKYGEGAAGVVAQTGQPLIIKDYRTWNSRAHVYDADQPFSSVLSTPLIWRGNVTGVIHVLRDNEVRPFTDDDLELLMRFANHAAIAVEQARLYNALERELVSRRHAEQALRELNARLEQRVAERTRELTDANVRLTELDRLKDEFIARISHELRTPLTSIKIYLELLEHGRLDKREQYMRTLHDEANKLRRQIDDLLEVSHLQTAGIEPQLAPLDVNHLVQDMIADQLAKAQARGLTLTIAAAADRPDVITDRALVWQVLSRLMANALAYTPRGGAVTLRTDRRAAADQAWVTIEVYDTGPGISEKDLPYIFEPFYRGLAASDYKTPGAGVGLSIAQRTIEQLGGRLTVDSQPGQGTAFTLWLRAG
jgi:PAS domain S-box-containing protein